MIRLFDRKNGKLPVNAIFITNIDDDSNMSCHNGVPMTLMS